MFLSSSSGTLYFNIHIMHKTDDTLRKNILTVNNKMRKWMTNYRRFKIRPKVNEQIFLKEVWRFKRELNRNDLWVKFFHTIEKECESWFYVEAVNFDLSNLTKKRKIEILDWIPISEIDDDELIKKVFDLMHNLRIKFNYRNYTIEQNFFF